MDQSHFLEHIEQRPEGCRYRRRRCLLKGCERWFWPRHPRSHYCSEACRQAARRWRRWHASQQYRASEQGRERRREQARRYRQRLAERQTVATSEANDPQHAGLEEPTGDVKDQAASADENPSPVDATASCEGQRNGPEDKVFSSRPCRRPGCYELFLVLHEHSPKCFCSIACRLALRRVIDRDESYAARRRQRGARRLPRRIKPPNTS